MTARSGVGNAKTTRAECAVNDAFVAGAVERDHRVRVAPASREVVLRAAEIADAFFARRRHELDRMLRGEARAVDLAASASITARPRPLSLMPGPDEPLAVAADGKVRISRGNTVSRCAQITTGGRSSAPSRRPMTFPASSVWTLCQSAIAKSARDPLAALLFFAGRRGDLRDGDLRAHDRVVVRRETRVRGRERTMCCTRVGKRRRTRSHAFNCDGRTLPRKW